jgi:hypothetical protein
MCWECDQKAKRPRGTGGSSLRLVAGQGGESPRSGRLHEFRSRTVDDDARATRQELPSMPETAARDIHVLVVSLHGAADATRRRASESHTVTTLVRDNREENG